MTNSYIINLINDNFGTVATVCFIVACFAIEKAEHIKMHPISWLGSILTKELSDELRRVEKENDMRRIKDLKSEILAFARSLKRYVAEGMEDNFDEEDYNHIFEAYEEYEELLAKYYMRNGKTSRAMGVINGCAEKHGFGCITLDL